MSAQGPASAGFCAFGSSRGDLCRVLCLCYNDEWIVPSNGRRLYSHLNLDIIFGANTRLPLVGATEHMPLSIRENVSLKDLTTFRVGGPARYFCVVTNEAELVEAVDFSPAHAIPFFILGGGSNIVVSDEGFDGLVIKMEMRGI